MQATKKTDKSSNRVHFSISDQVQIMGFLFSFAKPHWFLFLISTIAMIISAVVSAAMPLVIKDFLDGPLASSAVTTEIALSYAGAYLLLIVINMIFTYLNSYTFSLAAERSVANMRNTLYHKLSQLNMEYFNQTPNGSVVSRITNDTETIKQFWQVFLVFFQSFFSLVTIAVAMFSLDQRLSWIFMAFIPLVLLLIWIYQRISTTVYTNMRQALSTLNAKLSESTSGMWLIQQFNQTDRMTQEFEEVSENYVTHRWNMFKMNAWLLMPAVNLIQQIVLVLVIWVSGRQLLEGLNVNIGTVSAFISYATAFFAPIADMMDVLSIYQDGLVSGYRGMRFLDNDLENPVQNPGAKAYPIKGQVDIKNLSFSYDGEIDVLKNINVQAEPGQMIAFVGHTGSGKSTIINLLMRFYDFERGEILIDGRSIKDYDMDALRDQMGLVLQDSFIFYGNYIDNIRLHGDYTEEEVIEAARFSGASAFIEKLEDGYHSHVAEGGSSLSAGQKQLISIARTVLRDPSILILDEATANIDTETEGHIQDSLERIRKDRTMIVIAHRLSTIRDADRIYVLQKGRIIEEGKHDELIEKGGTYYDMYQLQTLQGGEHNI